MTEPKHTHGPWYLDDMEGYAATILVNQGPDGIRALADVWRTATDGQGEANARLMAAAPALLLALIKLLDDIGKLSVVFPGRMPPTGAARAAMSLALNGDTDGK